MSDGMQFTIDPRPAQQGADGVVKALQDILKAAEFHEKRTGDSMRRAAEKIAKLSGVDLEKSTTQASGALEKLTKSTYMAGSAGAGLVNNQNELSAAVRRTARSVAILQGPLGPVAGRITMLGVAVGDVGIALTALGLTLTGVAAVLIKASRAGAEAESQFARMDAVLKATGGTANQTMESIENQARNIGRYTLASVQEVRTAATQLLTFRKVTEDAFGRALALAQDLAAVGFGSLEGAARQLARALEDPEVGLTSLRRAGVSFTREQRNMIVEMFKAGQVAKAQGIILDEVAKQVGGAGIAAAVGLKASFDTLSEEFKLLLEAIGQGALYEQFGNFLNKISASARYLHENIDGVVKVSQALFQSLVVIGAYKFATIFFGFAASVWAYSAAAVAATKATGSLTIAMVAGTAAASRMSTVFAFLARHPIMIAVMALTAAFYALSKAFEQQNDVSKQTEDATNSLNSTISRVMDTIFDSAGRVRSGTAFTEAKSQVDSLKGSIDEAISSLQKMKNARQLALSEGIRQDPSRFESAIGDIMPGGAMIGRAGVVGRALIADFRQGFKERELAEAADEATRAVAKMYEDIATSIETDAKTLQERMKAVGSDAAMSLSEGIDQAFSRFEGEGTIAGLDVLVSSFENARRSFEDIINPTENVDNILSNLEKSLGGIAEPTDKVTASFNELSANMETTEASLGRMDTAVADNEALIGLYQSQIASLNEELKYTNLTYEERIRKELELASSSETLRNAETRMNNIIANQTALREALTRAVDQEREAKDRLYDNLRTEIQMETEKVDAMYQGEVAMKRVTVAHEKYKAAIELNTKLTSLFGEEWQNVAEAVQLYDQAMRNIERKSAAPKRSAGSAAPKKSEAEKVVEKLREEVEEHRLLAQGIERTSVAREVDKALAVASETGNAQLAATIRQLAGEYLELDNAIERQKAVEKSTDAVEKIKSNLDGEYAKILQLRDIYQQLDEARELGVITADEASTLAQAAANQELALSLEELRNKLDPNREATQQYADAVDILNEAQARGLITGVEYLELMSRMAEPGDYWANWLLQAEQSFTSFDEIVGSTLSNINRSFGNTFAQLVHDGGSASEKLSNFFGGIARSLTAALGEMIAQWLTYKLTQATIEKTAQVSAATTMGANATAMSQLAGINAYASAAAIPMTGWMIAPGAMAAAIATTAPLAASVFGTAMAGIAHGGIDNVPREGTWLLDRDERVLQPQANKDLTEFLKNQKGNETSQRELRIYNIQDPGLVKEYLQTPEGENTLLNFMHNKSSVIRTILT